VHAREAELAASHTELLHDALRESPEAVKLRSSIIRACSELLSSMTIVLMGRLARPTLANGCRQAQLHRGVAALAMEPCDADLAQAWLYMCRNL
jgi:hypothetical protein